jgi:uncharacterized membrane protein
MGSPASSASPDRKVVRKRLMLFGVLGIIGVLLIAVSVVLGLVVLVAAEAVFLIAYRSFSKSPS